MLTSIRTSTRFGMALGFHTNFPTNLPVMVLSSVPGFPDKRLQCVDGETDVTALLVSDICRVHTVTFQLAFNRNYLSSIDFRVAADGTNGRSYRPNALVCDRGGVY